MSKARDELIKMDYDFMHTVFCDESVYHYNVMQLRDKYKEVIAKLKQENRTLKLEQGQCLNCTAKHKEELLVLEQEIEEYRKIYAVLTDDVSFLKQQKVELLDLLQRLTSYQTKDGWLDTMLTPVLNKYKDVE